MLCIDTYRMSVCELTFPIIQRHATAVITVSEEEIVSAMRLVSNCVVTAHNVLQLPFLIT